MHNRSLPALLAFVALIGIPAAPATAQEPLKELTLRDAVLQAGTRFAPESLSGLQWIPGTDSWSYTRESDLLRGTVQGSTDEVIATIADLNSHLLPEQQVKRFPSVEWVDARGFLITVGGRLQHFDLKARTLKPFIAANDDAEHTEFSPDHQRLAFTSGGNLFVSTRSPEDLMQVTTDAADGIVIGSSVHRDEYGIHKGTFWSPDGRKLAFYRMDERMVSPYYVEDIGTKPSTFNKVRYPMAGDTSHQVRLQVFDLTTFDTVTVRTDGAPDDYLTNISWDASGRFVHVIHLDRATQHLRAVRYDATTGKAVKTLVEERSTVWLEPQEPLHFLKTQPSRFIHWSDRDGWRHLYLYDVDKGLQRQLTKGAWEVKRIIGTDPKEAFLFLEGTATVDPKAPSGALETHLYRVKLADGTTERLTKSAGTHRGSLSGSGAWLIDRWSSTTVAGRTDLIDTRTGQVKRSLIESRDRYAGFQVGTVELFHLPGEHGDLLNARLVKPHGFDPTRKYPVLIYVYNGPHVQLVTNSTTGGAAPWMLHAAERGYLVCTVDGHGTPGRGRDFEQRVHRQLGITEVKDQLFGVDWLKAQPFVDGTRIGVHGWSFGGHMTTAMLLRHPGTFKVGVAGGPVMDWAMYEVMYTERYMDTPQENPDGYTAARLADKCDQLQAPLLVIHGLLDDVVLPEHSYTFLKDCVSRNKQVEFFVYPGHPHNVRGKDRLHLMEKVLDRMDRELRPTR